LEIEAVTKSRRIISGPRSMVIIGYADGCGRTTWIDNQIADRLIRSLKKRAKAAAGTRPLYVIRCHPKQIEGKT
jgi:hypothetical protein